MRLSGFINVIGMMLIGLKHNATSSLPNGLSIATTIHLKIGRSPTCWCIGSGLSYVNVSDKVYQHQIPIRQWDIKAGQTNAMQKQILRATNSIFLIIPLRPWAPFPFIMPIHEISARDRYWHNSDLKRQDQTNWSALLCAALKVPSYPIAPVPISKARNYSCRMLKGMNDAPNHYDYHFRKYARCRFTRFVWCSMARLDPIRHWQLWPPKHSGLNGKHWNCNASPPNIMASAGTVTLIPPQINIWYQNRHQICLVDIFFSIIHPGTFL